MLTSCRLAYRSNTAHLADYPHARQDCGGKWKIIFVGYNNDLEFTSHQAHCYWSGIMPG